MKNPKPILLGGLFPGLMALTFGLALRGQDPAAIRAALARADPRYLLLAAGCMSVFLCCEGKNIQRGLTLFGSPAPYGACLRYAAAGFFFSSVTPTASGGQPMQLLAMHRDRHPAAAGTLALLTEFFSFQLAAVTLAFLGFFLQAERISTLHPSLRVCFLLGVGLNVLVVGALLTALFSRRLVPWAARKGHGLVSRFSPERADSLARWGESQWDQLRQCRLVYRGQGRTLCRIFLTSLGQLAAYHSIPFWIYRSFGLSGQSLLTLLGLQAVLFVTVCALPLPGGVGLSEGGFLLLYASCFPRELLSGAMLLSRGVSFYLFLAICGIALVIRLFTTANKDFSLSKISLSSHST